MRGLRLRAEKAEAVGEHYTQIMKKKTVYRVQISIYAIIIGLSPSGKAPDFDSGIRWFESN